MASSLPYHEPGPRLLLIQSSFIVVLNVVYRIFDAVLYAGLIGQILVGIAWGTPGAKLLSSEAEHVIVQLGYIGLLLIVFEGGLSTPFAALKANVLLSLCVATIGIVAPIGLSFVLTTLANASPLQAFAAGAALCSTSLGTTFTLLGSSGLSSSRLGVVLTAAAVLDDIVGLVMVQIIASLGASDSVDAPTVIRPILVSLAFIVLLPLTCRFALLPAARLVKQRKYLSNPAMVRTLRRPESALVLHTAVLFAAVAGSIYAGASALLGAYIAGTLISWWDAVGPGVLSTQSETSTQPAQESSSSSSPDGVITTELQELEGSGVVRVTPTPSREAGEPSRGVGGEPVTTGLEIFQRYYHPALERLLKPFFFASVGFSIPITRMFTGSVVWRGLVFSVLMTLGKLVCGLWLLRLPSLMGPIGDLARVAKSRLSFSHGKPARPKKKTKAKRKTTQERPGQQPRSLYPGMILGFAMVARGEIGYLISALAESKGIFHGSGERSGNDGPSELFLITTWAITLCTVVGPLVVGFLVQRVRKLEKRRSASASRSAGMPALGVWGVSMRST